MRYLIMLIVGALIGGVLIFYLFVGAPRAKLLSAQPVKPPDAGGPPPGTAIVTLDENFFNALLGTILSETNPPKFRIAKLRGDESGIKLQGGGRGARFVRAVFEEQCPSEIAIMQEGGGVRTGVRFAGGKIVAPLAFSGSYSSIIGCTNFKGAAQTNIQLYFKPETQTLYGQINVEGVNLEGISPVVNPLVTGFVQQAINQRVNPIEVLRAAQLNLNVPIQASGTALAAQVKEIRADIQDGSVRLYITYDFKSK